LVEPHRLPKCTEYPLVYRSRIFYFRSEEERNQAKENIDVLVKNGAAPKDLRFNLRIFLLGKQKSGKSTLAKLLEEHLGLVRIKIKNLLDHANENPYWYQNDDVQDTLRRGETPSEG